MHIFCEIPVTFDPELSKVICKIQFEASSGMLVRLSLATANLHEC